MKKFFLIIVGVIVVCLVAIRIISESSTVDNLRSATLFLPYLLGQNSPTTYLILLGNDTEIRANGGFSGSYAKITFEEPPLSSLPAGRQGDGAEDRGVLSAIREMKPNTSFHDIYVPNGQTLDKYVVPPSPVQQAFGHGTWELANADWDPHFPNAATSLRWFFEKGGEINPDILGIVNLTTIKKILDIIGNFEVGSYNATLTPDNLYLFLQGKAEMNFFPGSTQKADALHNVGQAMIAKVKKLSLAKKYQIAKILYVDFKNQNIVLNSKNPDFQNFLVSQKLAGEYLPSSFDHFGMVEVNLGANKANAYVARQTKHIISADKVPPVKGEGPQSELREGGSTSNTSARITHQVNINFYNHSPEANPNPPIHYGGNYLAYLRLYLPKNATNIQITHSELATDSAGINKEILTSQSPLPSTIYDQQSMISYGFWHLTTAGKESNIDVSYELLLPNRDDYSLTILKQNGLPTSPQTLDLFGSSLKTDLTSPFSFP